MYNVWSSHGDTCSGVLQGSVIIPFPFLAYIDDLSNIFSENVLILAFVLKQLSEPGIELEILAG